MDFQLPPSLYIYQILTILVHLWPALYLLLKYFEMNPRYIVLRNVLHAYTEYLLPTQSQMQREKLFQGQEISED